MLLRRWVSTIRGHWILAITTNNCQPYKKYWRLLKIKNAKLSGFQMPGYKASCSKSADLDHNKLIYNSCHHNKLQEQAARQFPHFVVKSAWPGNVFIWWTAHTKRARPECKATLKIYFWLPTAQIRLCYARSLQACSLRSNDVEIFSKVLNLYRIDNMRQDFCLVVRLK